MKCKKQLIALLLLFSLSLSLSLFAQESYTITVAQLESLSQNLEALNSLIKSLRQRLDSYKRELQATAQELQESELRLVKAENESNTFILTLKKQETRLKEQAGLLKNAKTSLKRLRRRDRTKNILFALIIGGIVAMNR